MSNVHATFKQSDISRAIRANKATGNTHVIEIEPNGTIRLVPAELRPAPQNDDRKQPSDSQLESWD